MRITYAIEGIATNLLTTLGVPLIKPENWYHAKCQPSMRHNLLDPGARFLRTTHLMSCHVFLYHIFRNLPDTYGERGFSCTLIAANYSSSNVRNILTETTPEAGHVCPEIAELPCPKMIE